MESLHISLPVPNSPLRRQIGVSVDGYPLSPISLGRSISAVSSHSVAECCEEKTRKQLHRYLGFLHCERGAVESELLAIREGISESCPEQNAALLEQKATKEKELVSLMKKILKTKTLIDLISKEE